VCGGGGLFHHWFKIEDRCPSCGFVFGRGESGYQLGSMALDLIIPITSCILLIALSIFLTWPNPPWQLIQWGSIAYIVSVPLLFYPMSHTLAMFLDVLVRPPDLPLDTDQSAGK
jgi:uncharacterized protein (DUF983 family)